MRRFATGVLLAGAAVLAAGLPTTALAQQGDPAGGSQELLLFTKYPAQVIGVDENITLDLTLRGGTAAQVVSLAVQDLPEGWTATFRSGSRIVRSVYVEPDKDASVSLRVEPPAGVEPGVYHLTAVASGDGVQSSLPIELTVQEKVPASLSFDVDLPTLRGKPDSNFRYSVTLRNDGGEDLSVDLLADAPPFFGITFKSGGQEVTSLPLEASSSKNLSIEASPLLNVIPAGSYPITIYAQGGETEASIELIAEVVGESSLTLTTPDGRLSGRAEAGTKTPFTLVLQNTGSAPARGIEMSASTPSGWTVEFDPPQIEQIEPASQVEVTANVQPANKALAGDYIVTFRAQPEQGASESVEYRVTVHTSTLWGVVGIVLIAVAVGVVGLAVMRFGRR